jgi:hypothetical protein
VDQEAVASDPLDEALDGGVSDPVAAGALAVSGAADLGVEDGLEEVGAPESIGEGEGL